MVFFFKFIFGEFLLIFIEFLAFDDLIIDYGWGVVGIAMSFCLLTTLDDVNLGRQRIIIRWKWASICH